MKSTNDIKREQIQKLLAECAGQEHVLIDEPMSSHTTLRIGGPADFLVQPDTEEALCETVRRCRQEEIPYFILGNGSNLLVKDGGYRGVIIQFGKALGQVRREEGSREIEAGSGAMLSAVSRQAAAWELTGMEFASGIPGSIGGAVFMNAGAYGGEMKQIVKSVRLLLPDGRLEERSGEAMNFGYRYSISQEDESIILGTRLALENGDPKQIRETMQQLKEKRTAKQPLDLPSAGSTFKRPQGYFAGKLIEDARLRGFQIGGAQVSEKHCGFVVNRGGATAQDFIRLTDEVARIVKERFGVTLELEVRVLGE